MPVQQTDTAAAHKQQQRVTSAAAALDIGESVHHSTQGSWQEALYTHPAHHSRQTDTRADHAFVHL